MHEIAAYIRYADPEAYTIISYAPQPDGFSISGQLISELYQETAADPNVDAVGLNCVCGCRQMVDVVRKLGPIEGILSVMPNAGYPTVRGNRTFYDGDPAYFGAQLADMQALGARILGGCCGTTPEHIAAVVSDVGAGAPVRIAYPGGLSALGSLLGPSQ